MAGFDSMREWWSQHFGRRSGADSKAEDPGTADKPRTSHAHLDFSEATSRDKRQFLILVVIVAALFAIGVALVPFFKSLFSPQTRMQTVERIRGMGPIGFIVVILLNMFQIVVAIIPGEAVQVIAGIIYGALGGWLACVIGIVLAAALVYRLVEKLGMPFVCKVVPDDQLKKLEFLNDNKRIDVIVFILFFIPGLPKDVLTYVAPLSEMPLSRFLVVSTLARTPALLASTYAGASFTSGNYGRMAIVFIICGIAGAIGIINRDRIFEFFRGKKKQVIGRLHDGTRKLSSKVSRDSQGGGTDEDDAEACAPQAQAVDEAGVETTPSSDLGRTPEPEQEAEQESDPGAESGSGYETESETRPESGVEPDLEPGAAADAVDMPDPQRERTYGASLSGEEDHESAHLGHAVPAEPDRAPAASDAYEMPQGYEDQGVDFGGGADDAARQIERWRQPRKPGWAKESAGDAGTPRNRRRVHVKPQEAAGRKRTAADGEAGKTVGEQPVRARYKERTRAREGEYNKPYRTEWRPTRDEAEHAVRAAADSAKAVVDGVRDVWSSLSRKVASKTGASGGRKPTKRS